MELHIKIVTPKGVYKETKASIINFVNMDGAMGILPNHVPLVTKLVISKISMVENGVRNEYAIAGGLFQLENNEVMIITDAIERKDEIDARRAEEALKRAQSRMETQRDNIDILRAEIALKRAINRINVKNS